MNHTRSEALVAILDELDSFTFKLNTYYDDAEPQGVIDSLLTGKINSLLAFCRVLGWSELAEQLKDLTPLRGNAVQSLEVIRSYVIPEARRLVATTDIEAPSPTQWFWQLVHPRVCALARPRFEAGFFGDAVEASFKEVNDAVKRLVREADGRELDGAGLMTTAFSPQNPIVRLTKLETESDRSEQQGYMQIMAGAMTGIRNPKAHANLTPSSNKALHLICLASLLLHKLDERK
jgi:uncharacterized protein (TIGR02391 family)